MNTKKPNVADDDENEKTILHGVGSDEKPAASTASPPPPDDEEEGTIIFGDGVELVSDREPAATSAAPAPAVATPPPVPEPPRTTSAPSSPSGPVSGGSAAKGKTRRKPIKSSDAKAASSSGPSTKSPSPLGPPPSNDDEGEMTILASRSDTSSGNAQTPTNGAQTPASGAQTPATPSAAPAKSAAAPVADPGEMTIIAPEHEIEANGSEESKAESTGSIQTGWGSTRNTGATGATGVTGGGRTGGGGVPGGKPEPGMLMNQYEIIRLLGEGGMGAVYLARDTRLGRRVAIKFLTTTDPDVTKRFIIEARATARVEHENIVSIYEVGEWGMSPFMVLQFLQGQELTKVITKGKPMPVPRVVELMMPVLRALAYAHSEGIVHRDLKPDNIFVTDAGVTKVLDFGIAKVVQGDDKTSDGEGRVEKKDVEAMGEKNVTRHGAIMGTMPYMSPEQWGNGVAIDHTTDIWAVGIMMYRMLSGKHPLHPLKGHELMVTGFIDEPMPSLAEKAPELPREVIEIVDKCLMKDKAKRWADASALLRALEPFQRGRFNEGARLNIEESPYAGLSSFQEEDASRFFGRNREVAAMSQRLRERPIMAVVGPSGVGKSSFLRAGVVPALKNSGENWDISVIRPGRQPLMALAGLLMHAANTSTNIEDEIQHQHELAKRLAKEPGYLGTAMRRQARREKKNILLFIDQFEELYTLVDDAEERLAFTACLSATADDATAPVRVVVSIRSDFLDRCVEDAHFMNELSQGLFFITAPTRDGMRDALVQPAEMAGYKFESENIVNEMLDYLGQTSGALPLLQFTADKLWSERDPTRKLLTESSYRSLGGITGALASHADRILEQITGEQRNLVRALFLRLVTPERTRAIVSMDELREHVGKGKSQEVQTVIDLLVGARLLVVQTGGGGTGATVEIVHESLIRGWPQLAKWLDEGQDDAVFLEQLRNASRQWAAKNKDNGLLWRGEMVEEAKRFIRRNRAELPPVQQQFLKAVIDLSNRAARVRKVLYVTSSIILMALLAAAAVALYIINESREETKQQAIAAQQSEKRATVAAEEADKQRVEAEKAKEAAEKALAEAKAAEVAKDAAREAERKALEEANLSREQLQVALVDAKEQEKRAVKAANEALVAKAFAETKMREANEARAAATRANDELKVAMKEVERRRLDAEQAAAEAERKLREMTKGGVVEELR